MNADDRLPRASLGRAEAPEDRLIRQAVKAVAPHTLGKEVLGNCVVVCYETMPSMERSIEAGNLGQMRPAIQHRMDQCKTVRLMQRS